MVALNPAAGDHNHPVAAGVLVAVNCPQSPAQSVLPGIFDDTETMGNGLTTTVTLAVPEHPEAV